MKYIVKTNKTVNEAARALESAVNANKFGVLHVHDLKAAMIKKGVDFKNECRVFEVCNPISANEVLSHDMSLNMALPCRISIWEENSEVKIGTLKPGDLISVLSKNSELTKTADEVEAVIIKIINEAQ